MKQANEGIHVEGLRSLNTADRDYFDTINKCTIQYLEQSLKDRPNDLATLPLIVGFRWCKWLKFSAIPKGI